MREQIKKLMNKEEGFTLVELLAVIVILGIILAIAIPAVGSVIDNAQDDADTEQIELVKDSARLYVVAEADSLGFSGDEENVTVAKLITEGYLDFKGETPIPGGVKITKGEPDAVAGEGVYTYEYDANISE